MDDDLVRPTSLRSLVDSLVTFGRSHDGTVERDLYAEIDRIEAAARRLSSEGDGVEAVARVAMSDAALADWLRREIPGVEGAGFEWAARFMREAVARLAESAALATLPGGAEMRENSVMAAAEAAIGRMKDREGEDIDQWADALADDLVEAGEK